MISFSISVVRISNKLHVVHVVSAKQNKFITDAV